MEFLRAIKKIIFSALKKARKLILGREEFIKKIPLVQTVFGYLYRFSGPKGVVLVNVLGNKMLVPSEASGLVLSGCWEKRETEIFAGIIKPGMSVIDIGAHIGYYTLIASRLAGEYGKVFAFEPETENFSLLKKNIELNNIKNVTALNEAVSNSTGLAKLFLQTSALHSLLENGEGQEFINVKTVSLDDFFNKSQKIDLIKMDAEGSEYLILQGMKKLLENNPELTIITEFYPALLSKYVDPSKYLKELSERNFKIFEISGGKMNNFTEESWKNSDKESFNLLCQKK